MHHTSKLPIAHLNPHLTCSLCGGYFVDATTIIECLHSFCKSCIVRYLETNKFCPVCEVQIHKTKPLLHIRSDQTLQAVVYKLVPGLFHSEMQLRRQFYEKNPDRLPTSPQDRGDVANTFIYSSDEIICLSLEYADKISKEDQVDADAGDDAMRMRYLRCPAAVTVALLKRLVRGKYGLDANHALDILYGDSFLCDEYSLVDLAYMFDWKRKGPMKLKYRIYQEADMPPSPSVNETVEEAKDERKLCMKNMDEKDEEDTETMKAVATPAESVAKPPLSPGLGIENDDTKTDQTESGPEQNTLPDSKETASAVNGTVKEELPVETADTRQPEATPKADIPDQEQSSQSNGAPSEGKREETKPNKTSSTAVCNTLKLAPKAWKPSVNRVAAKRSANDVTAKNDSEATPAKKSSKTPRFFKVRNAPAATRGDEPTDGASVASVASVTESPVQEVAVNLTKPASGQKKGDKEKCKRGPSPRAESAWPNPARPYSAPNSSQCARISTADDTAKQKSPSHAALPLVPSNDDSAQQFRFPHPAWLGLARAARPGQMLLGGAPFASRNPVPPAHFLTSLIAGQPPFSYLSSVGMSLATDAKKATSSAIPNQNKIAGPRAIAGFPAPFNGMQPCGFPPGLSTLLPREILDSFYAYNQPRSFALPAKSSPSSSGNSCASGSSTSRASPGASKTKSQRPLAPRRVSAPPPLVPISPAPPIRSPPTLLPIKEVVDKDRETSPAASSSATERVTVVESSVGGSDSSREPSKEVESEVPAVKPAEDTASESVDVTSRAGSPPPSSETSPKAAADS